VSELPRLPEADLDHVLEHTSDLWAQLRGQAVFITGGTGFVGRWLLDSLLWADDKLDLGVSVLALTRDPQRFRKRAPHVAEHRALQAVAGDLASFDFPQGDYPYVIHAGIEPRFDPDAQRPLGTLDIDIAGTRRVLEFARLHGTRRMLFTSSGAVYGRQPSNLTHVPEEYPGAPETTEPGSAYGSGKRVAEFMCAMYSRLYGFDVTIARLFAFVGPLLPLDAHYAVGNFIGDVLRGGPVRVLGDGTPYRSYLYAADLAIWLWTILLRGKPRRPYNVGSPDDLTIADVARVVVARTQPETRIDIRDKATRGALPSRYVPDTRRAENDMGLRSLIALAEGVHRTWLWNRDRGFA
jgi:nucleoside-diphosphate-sugar epimerase